MATNKVEIGFDLSGSPTAQFARLDDAFYGILDAPQTILGGAIYQDVSNSVITYSINRGKSRQLDRYQAGKANVTLNNNTRLFDPEFSGSPYAGQIIPKRAVRITSNDVIQYEGLIDDWDLEYQPRGNSFASIIASDAFAQLANQNLVQQTFSAELTGQRILSVIQNSGVEFPITQVDLEDGQQLLQSETVADGAGAFQYLQTITDSEPGGLFIAKDGRLVFRDRELSTAGTPLVFADDGSGISYQNLAVVYGAELLYNSVTVSRNGGGTATASDLNSQEEYGILSLSRSGLPLDSDTSAQNLATYLVTKYAEPEYRFESLDVEIIDLDPAIQTQILNLELGDLVQVKFTPNNIPPAIDRYSEVIRISQRVTQTSHVVSLGLGSTDFSFWRLSDLVFGRLSRGNALAY